MWRRARWIEQREETPARAALLAAPAALYAAAAGLHRACWERGPWLPLRPAARVIAVGSPLVGGSGKTPFVAWLAGMLQARGYRVAVATRGFGRRGRGPVLASDGARCRADVERAGDEASWLAHALPGVAVLVDRDRARASRFAHARFAPDVLVLDDALQHHRIASDLRIATLDAAFGLGNGSVLPRGPLREPLRGLARVDAIVSIAGGDASPGGELLPPPDALRLARAAPRARRFAARRRACALWPLGLRAAAAPAEGSGLEALRGARIGVLCGLARPQALRASAEALGARVVATRCFADHHRYRARDLRGLGAEAPLWVTSAKDAVKLAAVPTAAGGADLRVLHEVVEPADGGALAAWIEQRLAALPPR